MLGMRGLLADELVLGVSHVIDLSDHELKRGCRSQKAAGQMELANKCAVGSEIGLVVGGVIQTEFTAL